MGPFAKRKVKLSEDPVLLRVQANALLNILHAVEAQIHYYQQKDYTLAEHRLNTLEKSLESERDMNAKLTEEIEQLTNMT